MENVVVQNIVNQTSNLSIELQVKIIEILRKNVILQADNMNYQWDEDIHRWQQIELERRIKEIEKGNTECFSWDEAEKDLNEITDKDNKSL